MIAEIANSGGRTNGVDETTIPLIKIFHTSITMFKIRITLPPSAWVFFNLRLLNWGFHPMAWPLHFWLKVYFLCPWFVWIIKRCTSCLLSDKLRAMGMLTLLISTWQWMENLSEYWHLYSQSLMYLYLRLYEHGATDFFLCLFIVASHVFYKWLVKWNKGEYMLKTGFGCILKLVKHLVSSFFFFLVSGNVKCFMPFVALPILFG